MKINVDNIKGSTGKKRLFEAVKKSGIVTIVGAPFFSDSVKSDVSGLKGNKFFSVEADGETFERVGYTVFWQAVAQSGNTEIEIKGKDKKQEREIVNALNSANSVAQKQKAFN